MKASGLEVLRSNVVELFPMLADRVEALDAWDDVRFLSVSVDRLRRWYRPGLRCIGDAAHATSPARRVGITWPSRMRLRPRTWLAAPWR